MANSWLQTYAGTDFEVWLPGGTTVVLRHDQHHPQLDAFLRQKHGDSEHWVFITAWNPRSQLLSAVQNQERQESLIQEVRRKKLSFYPGVGRAPDGAPSWSEDSILVVGLNESLSVELGRRFEQNAVLVGSVGHPAALTACFDGVFGD